VKLLRAFEADSKVVRGEPVDAVYLTLSSDGSGRLEAEIKSNFVLSLLEERSPMVASFANLDDMVTALRGGAAIDWLAPDEDVA